MKLDAANGSVGLCVWGDMINEGIIHHYNRRVSGSVKGELSATDR